MSPEQNHRQWVLEALDQYEGRLLRYAHRLLGARHAASETDDARDVVQFVFLRLCDQSESEINNRLAQWLYTVCRNRVFDILRVSGREKPNGHGYSGLLANRAQPEASEIIPTPTRRAVDRLSREHDPADAAEQSDLHALLRNLIAQLPSNQREALDLWSDGFSYVQISEITNHTEGHIRVLVHRALKTLRDHPRVKSLLDDEPTPTSSVSQVPTH